MLHNGRKIYNPRVIESIWRFTTGDILHEKVLKDQARAREARMNSKEYREDQEIRHITQQHSATKMRLIKEMRNSVKEIANQYVELIIAEFNINKNSIKFDNYQQREISFDQIENIVNESLPLLKKLKDLSEHELIISNSNYLTTYEAMFVKLIDLDARFALFAPKGALEKCGMEQKFASMTDEYKTKINNLKNLLAENGNLDYVSSNNEEYPENEKAEQLLNKIREEEFKSRFEIVRSTEFLCIDLYELIVKRIKLLCDSESKTLKFEDIKNLLKDSSMALNALKKSSADEELNEISGWDQFDPYSELFNKLMDVNIKFAFFAPVKSLNRLDIDFSRLTTREKEVMVKVLESKGLWNDKEFYETYQDEFLASLNETTI